MIHGYFFKTDSGLKFTDVFEGLIDVSVLTGDELGCVADTGNLLAWDVISTASELAKSVGGTVHRLDHQRRLHQSDEGCRHSPFAVLD